MIRILGSRAFHFRRVFPVFETGDTAMAGFSLKIGCSLTGRSARFGSDTARDGIVMLQGSRRSPFRFLESEPQRLGGFGKRRRVDSGDVDKSGHCT